MKKISLVIIISITCICLGTTVPIIYAEENNHWNSLDSNIQTILKQSTQIDKGLTGISIRAEKTGALLYEHESNTRLTPASNMKLLTVAVAMDTLGEDYTFQTEIYTTGTIKKGILTGNLYIKGKGDVTLLPKDLDEFARKVKQAGIEKINGDIIADDYWYDDTPSSIDMPWSDETTYYGAPVSALTVSPNKEYDGGTVIVDVKSSSGTKPIVQLTPKTNVVSINNNAKIREKEAKTTIKIAREHDNNQIEISGKMYQKSPNVREWIAVQDPTVYTLDLFSQSLRRNKIEWTGEIKEGKVPNQATLFASHQSMPLKQWIIPLMKLSNNTMAETLLKEIGKIKKGKGSFEKGLEVVKEQLNTYGMDVNTVVLRDGSGISPINYLSSNQLTQLLFIVQRKEWFKEYKESLPLAGEKERMVGGTLRNRFITDNPNQIIYAKTGSITTVRTISGYAQTKQGNQYIFSIMQNGLVDEKAGKELENKIMQLLLTY